MTHSKLWSCASGADESPRCGPPRDARYGAERRYELEKVLPVQARLLGLDSPATFRTACSLAVSYRMMGLDKDVENILRATLTIQKKMLGETHGDTVMTTLILDELLQDVGKL